MNELSMQEIDEVGGGVPIALAGPAIALGAAGFAALGAGIAAGWEMAKEYYKAK